MSVDAGSWLAHTKTQARLRLFCLPFAGGGATIFRGWAESLPPGVDVCPVYLPGRESRLREPLFTRLEPLVEALGRALVPFLDMRFAFFGHSMGALISFELARYLRRMHAPEPVHLFVAAHRGPQLPDRDAPMHSLPDAALVDALRRLGGTPQAVFEHEELLQIVLPILRADFELCETYVYAQEAPLDVPISVFGGEQDPMVSVQDLQGWY
ncbi:MAG: thioesterase, partial [Ktedonobacteraceae bacterium]|nr:thioesterase [Ktedonobacteraceae bacterium]